MTTDEERMRILKMVEEGTISAEDAARLLAALDQASGRTESSVATGSGAKRFFRVRVTDTVTGQSKVNVNLPMGLVDTVLRFIPDNAQGNVRLVKEAVNAQMSGKIVDVMDDESGQHVEIFIE
jgi:hypothetical protein